MAATAISGLTAFTAPATADQVIVVDDSAGDNKSLALSYLARDTGGTGAIVTGAYTLTLTGNATVPAGTAAMLGTAQTFTAAQTIKGANNTDTHQLILRDLSSSTVYLHAGQFANSSYIASNYFYNGGHTTDDATLASSMLVMASGVITLSTATASATPSMTEALRVHASGRTSVGTTTDSGQLTIDQSSSTAAIPVLSLDQADLSEGFIDFVGTSAASSTGPISTWTTGNTVQGHFAVEINGTRRWVRFHDDPTS